MAEPIKIEAKNYSKQFPNLKYLLVAYFHEDMFDGFDWKGTKSQYQSLIRYFKTQDSSVRNQKTPNELKEFLKLSQNWNEDKLSDVLGEDFSCMYNAPFFKMTYREFLKGILQILEEPIEKTKSEFIPKFIG